jgi:hypothetical protein
MNQPFTSRMAARLRISTVLVGVALLTAALAAPVAAVTVPTDPEPDPACPAEYGTGLLTEYSTTVQTPADSADWFISVEFTIANHGDTEASCMLSLSTYELPAAEFVLPQSVYSHDAGTFGPGTHVLTAELPRQGDVPTCYSQYDFAFGPVIDELTAENRYGNRQIRADIVGSETCELEGEQPAGGGEQPGQDVLGSQGGPASLPDTALSPPTSTPSWLAILALGAMAFSVTRVAAARRRR